MNEYLGKEFSTQKDLFAFLVENKSKLIAQKKAVQKQTDCIVFHPMFDKSEQATKSNDPVDVSKIDELKVKIVLNTTNLMDSHSDVHIPGLWTKTLSESKYLVHLQEHQMKFDKIIADSNDLKAYTKKMLWSELGEQYEGMTEALIFESIIKRSRNEYMFKAYANGWVKNHSVGMGYVKIVMCINDKDYGAEFEAWEKYFPQVANKEMCEEKGYFFAVTEAKLHEGSAVPMGSNWATPTLENNMKSFEPSQEDTQKTIIEPSQEDTQKEMFKYLITNLKK
jgi:hypothetical protein